jgi:hypothetical protein
MKKSTVSLLALFTLLMQTSLAAAGYLNLSTQANSSGDLASNLSVTNGTIVLDAARFYSTASASLNGAAVVVDSQAAPNVAYAQSSVYDANHQFDAIAQVMDFNPNADLTLIGIDINTFGRAIATYTQSFTVTGNGTVQYNGWYSIIKDVLDLTGSNGPIFARWDVKFSLVNARTALSTSFSDGERYAIDALSSGRPAGDYLQTLTLPGFLNGDRGYITAFASTEVVPEPGTFLLVSAGVLGLIIQRRQRT